jgi:hypothetical protein
MMHGAPLAWQLAGVEVQAFRGGAKANAPSKAAFMAAMLIAVSMFDRRAHSSGQAVCLLAPRKVRVVAGTTGAVLLVGLSGALLPPLGWAVLVSMAFVFLPFALRATLALPARVRLRRMGPVGRHVYVHGVASTRPGAGAELMRSLAGEADEKSWLLVLDAANEKLERYYSQFGFVGGGAVRMPDGTGQVRMWRRPQARGGKP